MGAKTFKFGESVVLCEFSGEYIGINQVDPRQEVIKVICKPADAIPGSAMFFFNDTEFSQYYVWYNRGESHKDPKPGGKTGVEVKTQMSDDAVTIATKTAAAIDNIIGFSASAENNIVTITLDEVGDVYPPEDYNTGFQLVIEEKGRYTTNLYHGRLWPDCKEIKDVTLHADGSAEIFFNMSKTYVNKMNLNKRFDINKEYYIDNYRTIDADWITYIS